MPVSVRETGAVDDHAVIEQRRIAFFGRLQFLDPRGELARLIAIDLRHLLHQVGHIAVMRERVMAVGNADLAVRPRGALMRDQKRDDAREIGLEGDGHHVGHQLEVFGEVGRHAVGLLHMRIDLGVVRFRFRDLPFDFANGREILVELAPVRGSEISLQLSGVVGDEIENAAAEPGLARAGFGGENDSVAEEPLEQGARVENRRQRLCLTFPRKVVGVGAGVTRIAVAGLARVFHSQFEGWKPGLLSDLACHDLVERDAGLDVDQGFARLDAGQIGRTAASMIAGAV